MKNTPLAIVAGISISLLLTACSPSAKSESPAPPSDPVAQMELTFEGSPRQEVISASMEKAFSAVSMEATVDNLSRAGSTLVAFKQEYGVSEMEILDCIPYRSRDPRVPSLNFPNVAAVCVTDLASGVSVP